MGKSAKQFQRDQCEKLEGFEDFGEHEQSPEHSLALSLCIMDQNPEDPWPFVDVVPHDQFFALRIALGRFIKSILAVAIFG